MSPAKWRRYRHRQDRTIIYEVRKVSEGRYEFRRPGDERILGSAPRDVWGEIYRKETKGERTD